MTDRLSNSLGNQDDYRLRYKRRRPVYSKRTLDGVIAETAHKVVNNYKSPSKVPVDLPKTYVKPAKIMSEFVDVPVNRPPPPIVSPRQQTMVTPLSKYVEEVADKPTSWVNKFITKSNLLVGMAGLVFLLGVGVSLHSVLTNKNVTEQVQAMGDQSADQDGGTSGNEKPDESSLHPGAVNSYKVAPEYPRKITVSKIGVEARIKPMGVDKKNQMLAPGSIYDVGWYNASAKPGVDAGAVLLDGHVHGPTKPGVFVNLKKLTKGDLIEVERGDGRIVKYRVEKIAQEPANTLNMAALLTSVKPGKQGLNLVTCGGKYDTRTGHYESRDEVFAVQI